MSGAGYAGTWGSWWGPQTYYRELPGVIRFIN